MSYTPLTLTSRPKRFEDFAGQKATVKILKRMVSENRIPSAVMLIGSAGTGKTSSARVLAKAVNCENPKDGEPCLECATCKRIEENKETDVLELDAASNRGIASVLRLKEWTQYQSSIRYRVAIIDEVHMYTDEAFNALLKTLEESANIGVFFILATTDPQKCPKTIMSRCQVLEFRKLSKEAMTERLMLLAKQQGVTIEEKVLHLIYDKTEGGVRDSVSDLDQLISYSDDGNITEDMFYEVFSIIRRSFFENLIIEVANNRLSKAFELLDSLKSGISNFQLFVEGFLSVFADVFYQKISENLLDLSETSKVRIKELSAMYSLPQVKAIIDKIQHRYLSNFHKMSYLVLRLMLIDVMELGNMKTDSGSPADNKIQIDENTKNIADLFGAVIVSEVKK